MGKEPMTSAEAREQVVLVDSTGRPTGTAGKLEAHASGGILHLGFSILIYNKAGELLLQRRASGKYHFADYWSNSCCGHPRPGEDTEAAAGRRLHEELGFAAELHLIDTFIYRADDEVTGLTEKEWLSVFVGIFNRRPNPSADEVQEWRWVAQEELLAEMKAHPDHFTPWFQLLLEQSTVLDDWRQRVPGASLR